MKRRGLKDREAAVNLYGQNKGYNGCNTTIVIVHHGYADIDVYNAGDKIGTFYGVQAARPTRHTLKRQ